MPLRLLRRRVKSTHPTRTKHQYYFCTTPGKGGRDWVAGRGGEEKGGELGGSVEEWDRCDGYEKNGVCSVTDASIEISSPTNSVSVVSSTEKVQFN